MNSYKRISTEDIEPTIKALYKEKVNNVIKDIDIDLDKGSSISIECSNDISDLLVNLILGRETPAKVLY